MVVGRDEVLIEALGASRHYNLHIISFKLNARSTMGESNTTLLRCVVI